MEVQKGLSPGQRVFLCMFLLCLCGFSLGVPDYSHNPETCMFQLIRES